MSAIEAVTDGTKMTNDDLGALTRRVDTIKQRISSGSLSYMLAMRDLQKIVDHKPLMAAEPWRKSSLMGRDFIHDYIEKLRGAGYFIAGETAHMLLLLGMHYFPGADYLADFWRFTPADLGLEAPLSYRRLLKRSREVVPFDTSYGLLPPTIETGLMLALSIADSPLKYHEEIVVATEPFRFREKDYLLTILGDTEATCILLREVKKIEEHLFSIHPADSSFSFAVMGTPYHEKQ